VRDLPPARHAAVRNQNYPDTKACPPTAIRLFPIRPGRGVGYGRVNIGEEFNANNDKSVREFNGRML